MFKEIGDLVKKYMKDNNVNCRVLAEKVFIQLGFQKPSSAQSYISYLRTGGIYGYDGKKDLRYLKRTSILLYEMNVPKDHEIISKIKVIDSSFEYPPKEESKEELEKRIDELTKKLKSMESFLGTRFGYSPNGKVN